MKKTLLFLILVMAAMTVFSQSKMSFEVKGPKRLYNQVRVVNESSFQDFHCRVVVLNEDNSVKEVYGDYELKKKGDSDSNTNNKKVIKKKTRVGIQFPKKFTEELSFFVEYKSYPMFNVIVIHLLDPGEGYEEF